MKRIILLLIAIFIVFGTMVAFAPQLIKDPGYVLISTGDQIFESTIVAIVIRLVILFVVLLLLIKLLKSDSDDKDFFARMLIFQEDENTEDYFVELINNDAKDKKCIWGALYFATYNKQEYIDLIAKIVVNGYSLTGMISSLCSTSKDFAILLLNNEVLLQELDKKERENYRDYGFKHFVEKTNKEISESTLFWKKYGNKE